MLPAPQLEGLLGLIFFRGKACGSINSGSDYAKRLLQKFKLGREPVRLLNIDWLNVWFWKLHVLDLDI